MRIQLSDLALPFCVSSALAIGLLSGRATAGEDPCGSVAEIARFDAAFIANFELFEDYLAVYLSEGLETNFVHLYDAHALPELVLRGTIELPAASNGTVFSFAGPGSGWIEIDGNRLYVHTIPVEPGAGERLHGWDISDLSSPEYLGSRRSFQYDHNVYRGLYYASYLDDDEPYAVITSFAEFPESVYIAGMDTDITFGSPFHFIGDYVLTTGSYYDPNIGGPIRGLFTSRLPDESLPPGMRTAERIAVLRSDDFLPYGFTGFTAGDGLAVLGNYNDEGVLVADITDPLDVRPLALLEEEGALSLAATSRRIGMERGVAYLPRFAGTPGSQVIELVGPNAGRRLGDMGLPTGDLVRVRNRTLIQRNPPANGEPTGPGAVVLYDLGDCGLCAADLVMPWRTLDLADIGAFASGFLVSDPQSDLNDDSVWDLADIQLFVASFNKGC